jgi:hypothetical protein
MRIEVQAMEAEGDWILALVHYVGCGKGSGVEITQPSWELSLWQEGSCGRYLVYFDEREGRRAFEDCAAHRSTG